MLKEEEGGLRTLFEDGPRPLVGSRVQASFPGGRLRNRYQKPLQCPYVLTQGEQKSVKEVTRDGDKGSTCRVCHPVSLIMAKCWELSKWLTMED